jgi:hypothetical protein
MADTLNKQPAESRLYDMDFSPRLATGENLSGVPTVSEKTVNQDTGVKTASTDLNFSTPTINLQVTQVRIGAGLDGVLYEVTFLANTSLGNIVEAEGLLLVQDLI